MNPEDQKSADVFKGGETHRLRASVSMFGSLNPAHLNVVEAAPAQPLQRRVSAGKRKRAAAAAAAKEKEQKPAPIVWRISLDDVEAESKTRSGGALCFSCSEHSPSLVHTLGRRKHFFLALFEVCNKAFFSHKAFRDEAVAAEARERHTLICERAGLGARSELCGALTAIFDQKSAKALRGMEYINKPVMCANVQRALGNLWLKIAEERRLQATRETRQKFYSKCVEPAIVFMHVYDNWHVVSPGCGDAPSLSMLEVAYKRRVDANAVYSFVQVFGLEQATRQVPALNAHRVLKNPTAKFMQAANDIAFHNEADTTRTKEVLLCALLNCPQVQPSATEILWPQDMMVDGAGYRISYMTGTPTLLTPGEKDSDDSSSSSSEEVPPPKSKACHKKHPLPPNAPPPPPPPLTRVGESSNSTEKSAPPVTRASARKAQSGQQKQKAVEVHEMLVTARQRASSDDTRFDLLAPDTMPDQTLLSATTALDGTADNALIGHQDRLAGQINPVDSEEFELVGFGEVNGYHLFANNEHDGFLESLRDQHLPNLLGSSPIASPQRCRHANCYRTNQPPPPHVLFGAKQTVCPRDLSGSFTSFGPL